MKKEIRVQVYKKYAGHCAYCGKAIAYKDMQVDHMKAKAHGGTDDIENLMPACRRCNHYKRDASVEVFRKMIEEIPVKLMRDNYIYKVAADYRLVPTKPTFIKFYFETEKDLREGNSNELEQ